MLHAPKQTNATQRSSTSAAADPLGNGNARKREPILYGDGVDYFVWPWWYRTPGTGHYEPGDGTALHWLGIALAATGIGFVPGMAICHLVDKRAKREFLARHGWTAEGPDRTCYGRYKNGVLVERYDYADPQVPPAQQRL